MIGNTTNVTTVECVPDYDIILIREDRDERTVYKIFISLKNVFSTYVALIFPNTGCALFTLEGLKNYIKHIKMEGVLEECPEDISARIVGDLKASPPITFYKKHIIIQGKLKLTISENSRDELIEKMEALTNDIIITDNRFYATFWI